MMRALQWVGTGLLFLLVAAALLATLLPPLLDRRYYDGPVSDHYDGERFFNPGDLCKPRRSATMMARFFSGAGQAAWPEHVPVRQGYPSATGTLCPPMQGAIVENWKRCVDRIDPRSMVATWIGHATVLVQAGGVNVLTDPVFSERASPFSWVGPKRVRAPGIRLADLPKIDLIVVSHNHYDHLDLPTLKALWDRDRPVIVTSLGNDTVLRKAGIGAIARDWGQAVRLPQATVSVERNHHWGSRWGADRNRALWSAFTISTPAGTIYYSGDTGLGDGAWSSEAAQRLFSRFGERIRLAILPIGAYEPRDAMKDNHVNPAESVRIFDQLRPAMALGVHWGTFQLTFEAINAPPRELARVRGGRNFVVSEVGRPIVVPENGVR